MVYIYIALTALLCFVITLARGIALMGALSPGTNYLICVHLMGDNVTHHVPSVPISSLLVFVV